jgi:hypothetical protein
LRSLLSAALCGILIATQLLGCANLMARDAQDVAPLRTSQVPTEAARLDVGVLLFDPGLPEPGEDLPERVYPSIRQAESIYFSCMLRSSMLETANWGDVRVVPEGAEVSELIVQGTIIQSDGAELVVEVAATDAAGREWMSQRYRTEVGEAAYLTAGIDPYAPMFHSIANDLAALQMGWQPDELGKLREISQLRYGADFVPEKFEGYLDEEDGELTPVRLPAEDDPVFQQVQQARAYESMFVGTLDTHYQNFCGEMEHSYTDWRGAASQEARLHSDLNTQRNIRIALIPVVIGLVVVAAMYMGGGVTDLLALMLGGAAITELVSQIKEKSADAAMHAAMLEELDSSFSAEVRPMVVETEETTVRLSGNVDDQYAQWRELLHQLYVEEEMVSGMTLVLEDLEPVPGEEEPILEADSDSMPALEPL